MLSTTVARGLSVLTAGTGCWALYQVSRGESISKAAQNNLTIASRLTRDVYTAGVIVSDYLAHRGVPQKEKRAAMQACHQRGAQRLLDLCFANGGIYIKFAQHVGQLEHLLPAAYVQIMQAHALDRCPVTSYAGVCKVFEEDMGRSVTDAFVAFEETPLASASLAQVHRAQTHDGATVAVKIQHPGLRDTASADIATISCLVEVIRVVFPSYDYRWLIEEIQENLPKELDFVMEAENAKRCKQNFASPRSRYGKQIHVPEIYPETSSRRVLTMEYVEGESITDVEAIRRLGFKPSEVAKLVSEAFSEQIFHHGFVHCDPHAANLKLQKDDRGRPRLVLLDHGLYRQISDEFRRDYAGLWSSLIFADVDGIRTHSQKMNAGELFPLFASMLTTKTWDQISQANDINRLSITGTEQDRQAIQAYAKQYNKEISELLLRIPRELLLLLKTNDCLRALDCSLGRPLNTFKITARECSVALARMEYSDSLVGRFQRFVRVGLVELRLLVLTTIAWWQGTRAVSV